MRLHQLLRMFRTRCEVGGARNTLPEPPYPYALWGYISAPITETEQFPSYQKNVNWLKKKSDELFQKGYGVYCPKVVWFKDPGDYHGEKYQSILLMDISLIPRLDFMYMRWGWHHSNGCRVEHQFVLDFNRKWWVRLLCLRILIVYQTEEEALAEGRRLKPDPPPVVKKIDETGI